VPHCVHFSYVILRYKSIDEQIYKTIKTAQTHDIMLKTYLTQDEPSRKYSDPGSAGWDDQLWSWQGPQGYVPAMHISASCLQTAKWKNTGDLVMC